MVVGIWLTGPTLMVVSATARGGEFWMIDERLWVAVAWILLFTFVPIYTFIMATYDGTLIALLAATCLLPASGGLLDRLSRFEPADVSTDG